MCGANRPQKRALDLLARLLNLGEAISNADGADVAEAAHNIKDNILIRLSGEEHRRAAKRARHDLASLAAHAPRRKRKENPKRPVANQIAIEIMNARKKHLSLSELGSLVAGKWPEEEEPAAEGTFRGWIAAWITAGTLPNAHLIWKQPRKKKLAT